MALIEAEMAAIKANLQSHPVGHIGQFRKPDGHIIKNTVNKGRAPLIGIAFFKGATRASQPIANRKDGFFVVLLG